MTYYDGETGERHEIGRTFDTEREAKKWGREQEMAYRQDPNRKPPSEETVEEFLDQWFPKMLSQRSLRPSSIARYRADMDHVKRLIGSKPLKNLTPTDIQAVYVHFFKLPLARLDFCWRLPSTPCPAGGVPFCGPIIRKALPDSKWAQKVNDRLSAYRQRDSRHDAPPSWLSHTSFARWSENSTVSLSTPFDRAIATA